MIPGISTGGGGFSGSSRSSADQRQSFNVALGGNQGLNFGASSDGLKLGAAFAAMTLAALIAYRAGRKRRG